MVQLTCSVGSAGRSRLCSDSAGARCGRPRCPVSPSRTLARLAAGPSLGWCSGAAAAACCASAGQAPNQGPLRAAALPPRRAGSQAAACIMALQEHEGSQRRALQRPVPLQRPCCTCWQHCLLDKPASHPIVQITSAGDSRERDEGRAGS